MDTWVILVTDGTVIEYPPEAYDSADQARDEARRWAWILSGMGWLSIDEPASDRWSVADRDVRLVRAQGTGSWVGTFWTWDGYPDPEALCLEGRAKARAWALAPLHDVLPAGSVVENDWMVAATFVRGEEEAYAVAHRLMRVAAPSEIRGECHRPPRTR